MTTPPPAPAATDEAGFVAELRGLRAWSGRSFRELERSARAVGETLPYSTAATMLGRHRLPRRELLVAYLRACGLEEADVARWVAVRAAIAGGVVPRPRRRWATRGRASVAGAARPRWRSAVVAAAALVVAFGGGALTSALGDSTIDEEIVVGTR